MNSAFLAARKSATRLLNPHTQQLSNQGKALQKLSIKSNIAVKDAVIDASSVILKSFTPPYNATVTERLLKAQVVDESGAINNKFDLVAINNCDEFGMGSSTTFSAYGPSYNPYSVAWLLKQLSMLEPKNKSTKPVAWDSFSWLTCGGSSGGSAVSVSLGLSDASVGTDTGGSVRQPAAFCGIVGFKPSYGRISRFGLLSYANSLDTVGFLSKSVQEVAQMLEVSAGKDDHDDTMLKLPPCPPEQQNTLSANVMRMKERVREYLQRREKEEIPRSESPLYGFRVGIPTEFAIKETEKEPQVAWDRAAKYLHELGAEIVHVTIPSTPAALPAYYTIAASEAFSNLARYGDGKYGYCATEEEIAAAEEEKAKRPTAIPQVDLEEEGEVPTTGEHFVPQDAEVAMDDAMVRLRTYNRSRGFGKEVQRRILNGCAILSANTNISYYDAATKVRSILKTDFASVFRPAKYQSEENPHDDIVRLFPEEAVWNCDKAVSSSPIAVNNVLSQPAGTKEEGVDILLTPVTPCSPWVATDVDKISPNTIYAQDIMTLPASLAHLPAASVPIGLTSYPEAALSKDIVVWKLKTRGPDAVLSSLDEKASSTSSLLANVGTVIAGSSQAELHLPKSVPPSFTSHPELVMSEDTMEKIASNEPVTDGKNPESETTGSQQKDGEKFTSLPMWSKELEAKVRSAACVPTSVQVIGRLGDENTLLLLSAALEEMAQFAPPAYVSGEFPSDDAASIRESLLAPAKVMH